MLYFFKWTKLLYRDNILIMLLAIYLQRNWTELTFGNDDDDNLKLLQRGMFYDLI